MDNLIIYDMTLLMNLTVREAKEIYLVYKEEGRLNEIKQQLLYLKERNEKLLDN